MLELGNTDMFLNCLFFQVLMFHTTRQGRIQEILFRRVTGA